MAGPRRVYLLSPASLEGKRARTLLGGRSELEIARRLGAREGIALGEVFAYTSGLYFAGKLRYAERFARPPAGRPGVWIIAPGRGLLPADEPVRRADLRAMRRVRVDPDEPGYRGPLRRALRNLAGELGPADRVILLGSIATEKYTGPLLEVLGERLLFPREFVGRGDMSRGGLLLRRVDVGRPLVYVPVAGAVRRGARPPKLAARR